MQPGVAFHHISRDLRPTVKLSLSLRWCYLLIWVMLSSPVFAQMSAIDNTNITPTPGSGHAYIQDLNEVVNPANGSVSVRIAANAPKERGVNLPLYVYMYDTNGQIQLTPLFEANPSYPNGTYKTFLNSIIGGVGAGFYSTGGSTITGATEEDNSTSAVIEPGTLTKSTVSMNAGPSHTCNYTTNYVYTDTTGVRHPLGLFYIAPAYQNGSACGYFGGYTSPHTTGGDDEIQAVLDPNSPGDAFIYDLHGNQLNVDYKIEDSNGNYQNASGRPYAGNYSSGPMPTYITIPGMAKPYTFSYPQVSTQPPPHPVSLNPKPFSGNDPTCPSGFGNGSSSNSSVGNTVINLPNDQFYTIQFDPNYGLISKITYPTGATVNYSWGNNVQSDSQIFEQGGSPDCGYSFDWPAVSTRIVSYDGVHPALEQDFTYHTSPNFPWTSKTTTVITKDLIRSGTPSFKTVYTYLPMMPYSPPWGPVITGSAVPVENTITYYDTLGNVLKTVTKTWLTRDLMSGECTTLPNQQTSGTFYQYGAGNLVTDKAEYDYGLVSSTCQRPSSTPTRETITAYQTFGSSPIVPGTSVILDRPSSVKVYDNGSQISETDYSYDQNSVASVSPLAINHDETNYAASLAGPRGNLTSLTSVCLSACTSPVTHYSYDETGQIVSVTDAKGNPPTTYSYTDNYASGDGSASGNTNTYVTTITRPTTNGVSHIRSFTYGFEDGEMRSSTDENTNNVTHYCYLTGGCSGNTNDPWARLTETTYPDGGSTTISYNDAGPQPSMTVSTALNSSTSKITTTTFDAYGHTLHAELTSDPSGADYVDTTYDGLGRVYTVSNPHRSSSWPSDGTTTYTYDALGRPTIQTQPDNTTANPSVLQWCYNGVASSGQSNCLANGSSFPSDSWVDFSDETGRHWQRVSDALARMRAVREPDGTSNISGPPTLETDYQYNALGNLNTANQHGLVRTFTYDSLSRLVCSANPEIHTATCPTTAGAIYTPGTIGYSYDANGNLISKIAPAPNAAATSTATVTTTYVYDALNRLTGKSYSDGVTPGAFYGYDESSVSFGGGGIPVQNGIGRMTSAGTGTPSSFTWKSLRSYDPMGRVIWYRQYWNDGSGNGAPGVDRWYDLAGNQTLWDNGAGRQFATTYDAAGRAMSMTTNPAGQASDGTLVSNVTYGPAGEYLTLLGNGSQAAFYYDNRMRVNNYRLAQAPNSHTYLDSWGVTYDKNSNVVAAGDANSYSEGAGTYTYDNLNRLNTVVSTLGQSCQYTYDTYGNRTSEAPYQSGTCFNSSYTFSGNRITTPGYLYDAVGNLVYDGTYTYGYDAENRLASVQGTGTNLTYQYNPDGTRTTKKLNGVITKLGYDETGKFLWTNYGYGGGTPDDMYFNGRHFGYVVVNLDGSLNSVTYSSVNWLGTELARFDSTQNVIGRFGSLPFGDNQTVLAGTNNDTLHFTGKERDAESGLDYFGDRYYASSVGRFMTPDYSADEDGPQPVPYANPEDPQGFNLYAYAGNNPLSNVDPDGHFPCPGGNAQDVACMAQAGWNWLKNLFSGSTNGNNGDNGPSTPQSNDPNFTPQLRTRTTQIGNWAGQQHWIPPFLGGAPMDPSLLKSNTPVVIGIMPWGMTGGLSWASGVLSGPEQRAIDGVLKQIANGTTPGAPFENVAGDLTGGAQPLPPQAPGYYTRYTVNLGAGKGSARLVTGLGGEIYYTTGHYIFGWMKLK